MSPIFNARRSQFGVPVGTRPSIVSYQFAPVAGFTELPPENAPAGSFWSGENVWIRQGRLEPRGRLQRYGDNNPTTDLANGLFLYDSVSGNRYPVATSKGTVSYFNIGTRLWTTLSYVSSGTSDNPPSGGAGDLFFGTSSFLPRIDENVAVFTNGVDPVFAWGGPTSGMTFSTLTQGPIAKDVINFDNRLIAWNVAELSSLTQYVTRVAWTARGDPEDWTGEQSGFVELLTMRGAGTRLFAVGDEFVLASSKEIWLARRVGPPFIFDFSPLVQELGMPYPRAAIQTETGIYWLGGDLMIYRLAGRQVSAIGSAIHRTLHDRLVEPERCFFTWHPDLRHLSFWYTTVTGFAPNQGFTFSADAEVWTPQRFPQHRVSAGLSAQPLSSSATTWGGLVSTIESQLFTYNQLLGISELGTELFVSGSASVGNSGATTYTLGHSTSTSDDGTAVPSFVIFPLFGPEGPTRTKLINEVRLNLQANRASVLSIGLSTNGGATYVSERTLLVSAASNSSQYLSRPSAIGANVALRIRSEATGDWQLRLVTVHGQDQGRST